jgi:hypothetical protein
LFGGHGFDVRTPRQLREALAAASSGDRFALVDVKLQKGDSGADADYRASRARASVSSGKAGSASFQYSRNR